jgi:hypothetical protein
MQISFQWQGKLSTYTAAVSAEPVIERCYRYREKYRGLVRLASSWSPVTFILPIRYIINAAPPPGVDQ